MKFLIKFEVLESKFFIEALVIFFGLAYIALCVNSFNHTLHMETDNLDYILPAVVILIVIRNFKYLKIKKELETALSFPIDKKDNFKAKYISAHVQFLWVYAFLVGISLPLYLIANRSLEHNFNLYYFDALHYIISVGLKGIFSLFLLNFYLFFFLKGKNIYEGICYIALSSIITTLCLLIAFFSIGIEHSWLQLFQYFAPLNLLSNVTALFDIFIYNGEFKHENIPSIINIISIIIFSLGCIPFIFKKGYAFTLETLDTLKTNIRLIRIILLIVTAVTIILISLLPIDLNSTLSLIIILEAVFYLIYCTFVWRVLPTVREAKVCIIIFILGLIAAWFL